MQLSPSDRRPAGVAALTAAVWIAYLGSGSTALYLLLTLLMVGSAFALGQRRHWGATLIIVATATLVGTEFRGELGSGSFFGQGVRLLDLVVLGAGAGVALASGWVAMLRTPAAVIAGLRPFWVALLLLAYVTVLWAVRGPALDSLVRTDVRLLLLGVGTYVVGRATVRGHERAFGEALLILGALVALKALALHVSSLWTVGTFDRAQATQVASKPKRTILVGGDTLLILLPAIASSMLGVVPERRGRLVLLLVAALGFVAVLLSGTRSSLLVAAGLFLLAPFVLRGGTVSISRTKLIAAALAAMVLLGVGTVATGVGDRFTRQDGQHEGLGYREDEIRSAVHLPARKLLVGQGIGGNFVTKTSAGTFSASGWSHVLPVWVILKIGALGLLALLAAAALGLWRVIRGPRAIGASVGLVVFAGLVVMSLTIGRATLPEGIVLSACCFVLFGWGTGPSEEGRP